VPARQPRPRHSTRLDNAEALLRQAARLLEVIGVTDDEMARTARVVFQIAQRVAVDAGRLERAA
jgi:hypothetical protein